MSDYDNTNTGVLFQNDRRETDRHPNMTGSINIAGRDHYLSAWTRLSKNGKKFLSISIGKPKGAAAAPEAASFVDEELDDDLPF